MLKYYIVHNEVKCLVTTYIIALDSIEMLKELTTEDLDEEVNTWFYICICYYVSAREHGDIYIAPLKF